MLVKMSGRATSSEIAAIEEKLHGLGYTTGKMVGEEITLIGVYGDITQLPTGEIQEMAGVDRLIPISRAYKRVAQKGAPGELIHQTVRIGNVEVGGNALSIIAGPCSVESEAQIMETRWSGQVSIESLQRLGRHRLQLGRSLAEWTRTDCESRTRLRTTNRG